FVGLYEVSVTTGDNLAKVLKDVLLRLNLSITGLRLRGQAHDGAANMAGKYSGAQAIIKESQPLALYVHCGPHCVNLEEMACGHSESACRANGLFDRFQKGNVLLGLLLALEVTEELECLNASLQSRTQTVVNMQFQERFEQEGLPTISSIEKVLLTGESDAGLLEQYPELHCASLKVQLAMFKSKYDYQSTTEAANTLRNMLPEVRQLFDQVETLVRLLLVCPVSSAEAERSFSCLRRLKTWLRSTMTQSRLNNVAVCHIHSDKLDSIDREMIAQQFIDGNQRRRNTFGSFK
ncbi:hypothetical protein PO909_011521, partial [Leuciscus waleckii]